MTLTDCNHPTHKVILGEDLTTNYCHVLQPAVPLLINGEFRESTATDFIDVTNPVSVQLVLCSTVWFNPRAQKQSLLSAALA